MAIPTNGAKAIKGIPNAPCNLESITTKPVADTTTIKVPMTSATNFFWLEVNLLVSLTKVYDKFFHSLFNDIPDLSYLLYWLVLWVFYLPIQHIVNKQSRTGFFLNASHIYSNRGVFNGVLRQYFWSLSANINTNLFHYLHCNRIDLAYWPG